MRFSNTFGGANMISTCRWMDYYTEVLWDSVPIGKSNKIWSVSTPNKIHQIQLEVRSSSFPTEWCIQQHERHWADLQEGRSMVHLKPSRLTRLSAAYGALFWSGPQLESCRDWWKLFTRSPPEMFINGCPVLFYIRLRCSHHRTQNIWVMEFGTSKILQLMPQ